MTLNFNIFRESVTSDKYYRYNCIHVAALGLSPIPQCTQKIHSQPTRIHVSRIMYIFDFLPCYYEINLVAWLDIIYLYVVVTKDALLDNFF